VDVYYSPGSLALGLFFPGLDRAADGSRRFTEGSRAGILGGVPGRRPAALAACRINYST